MLSLSDINDTVCETLPTPFDNDYRGADDFNPNDIPTRFNPDAPVFAQLPDRSYALYDSRIILHENTIENPVMDGGGKSVLRSTLRAQRDGIITRKYPWAEEYFLCKFLGSFCLPCQPCQHSQTLSSTSHQSMTKM